MHGVSKEIDSGCEGNTMAFGCGQRADRYVETDLGAYGKEKRGGLQRDNGMIPSHDEAAPKKELSC